MVQQAPKLLSEYDSLPAVGDLAFDKLLDILEKIDIGIEPMRSIIGPYKPQIATRYFDRSHWRKILQAEQMRGTLNSFLKGVIAHLGQSRVKASNDIWLVFQFATRPPNSIDRWEAAPDLEGALIRWEDTELEATTDPPDRASRNEKYLRGYFNRLLVDGSALESLINRLQALQELSKSVVSLSSITSRGSGFRIGLDLILTNYHVLDDRRDGQPPHWHLTQYLDRGDPSLSIDIGQTMHWTGDRDSDWAVLRVNGLPDRRDMPVIRIDQAARPTQRDGANIIQYPNIRYPDNEPLKFGFMRNTILSIDPQGIGACFRYLTDTDEGSSGSPIFDDSGKLIGMHARGGDPVKRLNKGVEIGNEGIVLADIVEQMRQRGVIFGEHGAGLEGPEVGPGHH